MSQTVRLPHRVHPDLAALLGPRPDLLERFKAIKEISGQVRVSEYHITHACNIRCKGCWFFTHDFDKGRDERDLAKLEDFIGKERERGVNSCLLIGGEPTLFPKRVEAYVRGMDYVSISTNGLKRFPMEGFEDVQVFVSLFGGGTLDDTLRAHKPNGTSFTGLFDTALANYREDPRVTFVYAITEAGIEHIEPTVRRIAENGNKCTFNFYSQYDSADPLRSEKAAELLAEALRVKAAYPTTVLSTPYYIEVMITGKTHFGEFGYHSCPSISVDHPAHTERIANGNRVLPRFNTWSADLETVNFCCTSGHCEDCRDSQAVFSWLMVSAHEFMGSVEDLETWLDLAESYWGQFIWSPVRPALFDLRRAVGA